MPTNRMLRKVKRLLFSFFITLFLNGGAFAATIDIDTASLLGQSGQVAFDFIDGGKPSNSFFITNINFGIGSSVASNMLSGGVSGSVLTSVQFTDINFYNQLLVNLQFGHKISFSIDNINNLAPMLGSLPDSFAIFLLDNAGQSLVNTNDPTGAQALLRWDLGSDIDAANIYSDNVDINADNVASVPLLPASAYFMFSGMLYLFSRSRRLIMRVLHP